MADTKAMIEEFLAQDRIAVAGVSSTKEDAANAIYHRLKSSGHQVYAVNPNMDRYEDEPCYPDLRSIPDGVDGVVVVTRPEVTESIVHECAEAGVPRVWMHRAFNFMGSSISQEAIGYASQHGVSVIAGGCPMMFCQPVDFGHRCMRAFCRVSGSQAT